jgi:signal transduction histidine kinase
MVNKGPNAAMVIAVENRIARSTCSSDHWRVSVRDHGIGITERDQTHLFERFFRGTNVARVAGNGVGLHLVSMVLALHGGTIEVVSREGEGSTFNVLLPLRVRAS